MKRIVFGVCLVVLASLLLFTGRTQPVAGTDPTAVSTLQQSIEPAAELDSSASRHPCRVCAKDPTRCLQTCALEHCPGGCN